MSRSEACPQSSVQKGHSSDHTVNNPHSSPQFVPKSLETGLLYCFLHTCHTRTSQTDRLCSTVEHLLCCSFQPRLYFLPRHGMQLVGIQPRSLRADISGASLAKQVTYRLAQDLLPLGTGGHNAEAVVRIEQGETSGN